MPQASSEAFLAGKLLKETLNRALGMGNNLFVAHASLCWNGLRDHKRHYNCWTDVNANAHNAPNRIIIDGILRFDCCC